MNLIRLKHWDKKTSYLHFALALTVTLQIIIAYFMSHRPTVFLLHEIDGWIIFFIVLFHWYFSYLHKQITHHLLPWNKAGLLAIAQDLLGLIKMKLPKAGPRPGLPGLIHGLGLLAVTLMAFSGVVIFFCFLAGNNPHLIKHFHSFIAWFVWIYWLGHVLMAILHKITS